MAGTLEEQIAELDEKIAADGGDAADPESKKAETKVDEVDDDAEGEADDTTDADDKADDAADEGKDDKADDSKKDTDTKATAHDFFKKREEKRDATAEELRRLKAELEAFKAQAQPKKEEKPDPEPDKAENYEAWMEWKIRDTNKQIERLSNTLAEQQATVSKTLEEQQRESNMAAAESELRDIAAEFAARTPDYTDVATHYERVITASIAAVNPHLSPTQLRQAVKAHVMQRAVQYYAEGYNPIEAMYYESKQKLGYQPPKADDQGKADDSNKTAENLKKIDANKRKSASPLAGGSNGTGKSLAPDSLRSMSLKDFANLTPAELELLDEK